MKNSMEILVDFSDVSELIGTVYAAGNLSNDNNFMGDLIENAHHEVAQEFDREITATALASGAFKHMFEWGTLGINRGRSSRRPNPVSEAARLWTHNLTGIGKDRGISFAFKPSVATVPRPTVKKTKISFEKLSLLNTKHVFWNKAAIMESGKVVTISPKNGKFLFIPFYGTPPENASESNKRRGYMMYPGSVRVQPGEQSQGTFTAYWIKFWNGRGKQMMTKNIESAFNTVVQKELEIAEAGNGMSMTKPTQGSVSRQVSAAQKKSEARMRRTTKEIN